MHYDRCCEYAHFLLRPGGSNQAVTAFLGTHGRKRSRADGVARRLAARSETAHDELGFRYVRFHGLLSDDMGTVVRENKKLLYSFFNCDQVFDFLLSIGMKPFVELSFMPGPFASGKRTVFSYQGECDATEGLHAMGGAHRESRFSLGRALR